MKRKILMIFFVMVCFFGINNCVFADPNSSKGFAEYTSEQAEQDEKDALEKQEEELNQVQEKSRDSYLESLEVEGYKLTPKFDKQTIDYVIQGELKSDEIQINATASDKNAKIEGTGTIKLNPEQKIYEVTVTAEAGNERKYFIYLNEEAKIEALNETNQDEDEKTENVQNEEETGNTDIVEDVKKESSKTWLLTLIAIIVVVIIIMSRKKKG